MGINRARIVAVRGRLLCMCEWVGPAKMAEWMLFRNPVGSVATLAALDLITDLRCALVVLIVERFVQLLLQLLQGGRPFLPAPFVLALLASGALLGTACAFVALRGLEPHDARA